LRPFKNGSVISSIWKTFRCNITKKWVN
jgi:hypothetical protein